MQFMKSLARIALVPVFGMLFLAGGCDNNPSAPVLPAEGGQKQKEAREAAYGKAGIPKGTGTATNTQSEARQKAR